MNRLSIYLADGTFDGPITMSSPASSFTAIRVKRDDMDQYVEDLNKPGIYLLLIGNDTVYVGQSGLDTIGKRALNTHSGSIDSTWHTLVAFACKETTISSNELLFIENALCEYAHAHYPKCATTTPTKANCNAVYRNSHYHLGSSSIHTCNAYIKDILFYINHFGKSMFVLPDTPVEQPVDDEHHALFYFKNHARDTDGKAIILINQGHTSKRKTVLKAGSRISTNVLSAFEGSDRVKAQRQQFEQEGKIVNRTLQVDIPFDSQSGAGQFLNGGSFDGNSSWKRVSDDIKLKNLL